MTAHQDRAVAHALAGAFLGGEWTRPGMVTSGAVVLGARRRWLGPLARAVLEVYHRPPVDRPRELADVIVGSEPFLAAAEHAREHGRPFTVRQRVPVTTRMVRRRWPVPVLDDAAALAGLLRIDVPHLDWLADLRGYQRRTPPGPVHQYRYRWVERPGRVPRLIESPAASLLRVQRRLLTDVLLPIPVHPAAHGFVRGRNVATATAPHAGRRVLVVADLRTFFTSVTAPRVYGLLRRAGYPEPVAHTMTGLMTVRTPVPVITTMPEGGHPDERFRLRQALRTPHLPQGAATSPALANAVAHHFDSRCAGYARAAGFTYTRYADDLLFSADGPPAATHTGRLLRGITRIAADEGFALNPGKTRVRTAAHAQTALGVVLNDRPTMPRAEYDRLRAILHNAARDGGHAQNRDGHLDFRNHLAGRIGWLATLDPQRAHALREVFERIDWT